MESIKRLLLSLGYNDYDNVLQNLHFEENLIELIIWLENRKIRELEVNERDFFQNFKNKHVDTNWIIQFQLYLDRLNCPFEWDKSNVENIDCAFWLLSYAASLEYEDHAEDLDNLEMNNDNISYENDEELKLIVKKVALMLDLSYEHENTSEVLRKIINKLKLTLAPSTLSFLLNMKNNNLSFEELKEYELGIEFNDEAIQNIAIVLRMLHLSDFRELQNDLNTLIVAGQEYTANPKTNSSLGKVGI